MPSFQISITPTKRGAGRFVASVRRALQKAFAEESRERGLTQSDIAREIGVHRSVIHRELHGFKDITLGRVGELAIAMGRKPRLDLPKIQVADGTNHLHVQSKAIEALDFRTGEISLASPKVRILPEAD
jgi:transcriptional regulator with XRE-family HTH domain